MPKRIQRKRTKGWRMPPNTVYVGRPTKWGNPFIAESPDERAEVVIVYREYMDELIARGYNHDFSELRGKDLACWCPLDRPCHADVLLKLANEKSNDRHLFDEWYRMPKMFRCSYCGTRQILNLRETGNTKCVACTAPLGISIFVSILEVKHGTE